MPRAEALVVPGAISGLFGSSRPGAGGWVPLLDNDGATKRSDEMERSDDDGF